MILRTLLLLLVMGLVAVLFSGCNGPAPALDPVISFTFPEDTQLPKFPSGGVLKIEGEATTGDETTNPITKYSWTQDPAVGTFSSTTTFSTTWAAPTVDQPTPVTLSLTTETLLGGKTVTSIQLIVLPPGVTG